MSQTAQDNPVPLLHLLRNLFSGVVGADLGNPMHKLERGAVRAIQSRERTERRDNNLAEQARLRKEAVGRRKKRQMLAAEYARDRRASGHTRTLSKRQERALRTEERIARKRKEVHA
jgi:hypothetical protein